MTSKKLASTLALFTIATTTLVELPQADAWTAEQFVTKTQVCSAISIIQGYESSDFNLISEFVALHKTTFSDFFSQMLSHPW